LRQSFLCHEFLQDLNKSNATSATKGSEIVPLPEHRGSPLVCVSQYLVFCMVFYRLLFIFFGLSLLVFVLAVLWLRDSHYHYGISILCSCVLKMGNIQTLMDKLSIWFVPPVWELVCLLLEVKQFGWDIDTPIWPYTTD